MLFSNPLFLSVLFHVAKVMVAPSRLEKVNRVLSDRSVKPVAMLPVRCASDWRTVEVAICFTPRIDTLFTMEEVPVAVIKAVDSSLP